MQPVKFEQQNKLFTKPRGTTDEECGDLPVFTDGNEHVSKWKMSIAERIHCALRGYVWLRVWSSGQPPVLITGRKTEFKNTLPPTTIII